MSESRESVLWKEWTSPLAILKYSNFEELIRIDFILGLTWPWIDTVHEYVCWPAFVSFHTSVQCTAFTHLQYQRQHVSCLHRPSQAADHLNCRLAHTSTGLVSRVFPAINAQLSYIWEVQPQSESCRRRAAATGCRTLSSVTRDKKRRQIKIQLPQRSTAFCV